MSFRYMPESGQALATKDMFYGYVLWHGVNSWALAFVGAMRGAHPLAALALEKRSSCLALLLSTHKPLVLILNH